MYNIFSKKLAELATKQVLQEADRQLSDSTILRAEKLPPVPADSNPTEEVGDKSSRSEESKGSA